MEELYFGRDVTYVKSIVYDKKVNFMSDFSRFYKKKTYKKETKCNRWSKTTSSTINKL